MSYDRDDPIRAPGRRIRVRLPVRPVLHAQQVDAFRFMHWLACGHRVSVPAIREPMKAVGCPSCFEDWRRRRRRVKLVKELQRGGDQF